MARKKTITNYKYDYILFIYILSRIIIDGKGSGTVFNGHEPVFDELYTLTNHYVSGKFVIRRNIELLMKNH